METTIADLLINGGILKVNEGDLVNTTDGQGPIMDISKFTSGFKVKVNTGATASGPAWYEPHEVTLA